MVTVTVLTAEQRDEVNAERVRRGNRRRLIGAGSLSTTATVLFLAPALVLPGAGMSPMLAVVGVTLPAGVAALVYVLNRQGFHDLDTRTMHQAQPEPKRVGR